MQTEQRRWVRRADRRLVAGVAGGLADHTGTKTLPWRIAFVLMTLAGGLGVMVYVLIWWLIPRADLPQSAGQRFAAHFPDAPAWFGIGLLMFGAVLLAGQLGLWTPDVGWAFLLIGLGVVLYRREAERHGAGGTTAAGGVAQGTVSFADGSGAAPPVAPPAWIPGDQEPPPPWEGFPAIPPPSAPRPPKPPREHAWLGWLVLGLALCATGALWLLRDGGSVHLSLGQLFALPLSIIGAGLFVGAFAGRARWTILPGLMLVPIVLVASLITVPLNGRWEDRSVTPQRPADLNTTYEQSGGAINLDLTALEPGQTPGPVHVIVGIGSIRISLRKGEPVSITASAGFGQVRMSGQEHTGLGVSDTFSTPGPDQIVLDLQVDVGSIHVYFVPPQPRVTDGKASR
jgi:phage shock protein PspC (stress-responsive transcriptional regulator)